MRVWWRKACILRVKRAQEEEEVFEPLIDFFFFFQRERACLEGRGAGEGENLRPTLQSAEPDAGLDLRTPRS